MDHKKHERHKNILFKKECYSIQGAVLEVKREMGYFFLGTGILGMHGEGVLSSWHTACCSVETESDV